MYTYEARIEPNKPTVLRRHFVFVSFRVFFINHSIEKTGLHMSHEKSRLDEMRVSYTQHFCINRYKYDVCILPSLHFLVLDVGYGKGEQLRVFLYRVGGERYTF